MRVRGGRPLGATYRRDAGKSTSNLLAAVVSLVVLPLGSFEDAGAENLHQKFGPSWDCSYITAGMPIYDPCRACELRGMEFYRDSETTGHCVARQIETESAKSRTQTDSPPPKQLSVNRPPSKAKQSNPKTNQVMQPAPPDKIDLRLNNPKWVDAWADADQGYLELKHGSAQKALKLFKRALPIYKKMGTPLEVDELKSWIKEAKKQSASGSSNNRKSPGSAGKPEPGYSGEPHRCVHLEQVGVKARWHHFKLINMCNAVFYVPVSSCFAQWAGGCAVEKLRVQPYQNKCEPHMQSWDQPARLAW